MEACAHPAPPAPPALPALPALQHDIDAILAEPALARGYWGVVVKSLKTDETLYALNARKLMLPASNMKIVTLAAAAATMGWAKTYSTEIFAAGTIANGTLNGDLVVAGTGDPSLAVADGTADRVFTDWATRLKNAGIRAISGRIVAAEHADAESGLGAGWMWDDLVEDYAAPIGPLQLNEDAVRVTIGPGPSAGASAAVAATPPSNVLAIANNVTTSGSEPAIRMRRLPGSPRLELEGSIPLGHAPVTLGVSVDNAEDFFVDRLRSALIAHGIDVRGPAARGSAPRAGTVMVEHQSPPLSTLAMRLMKISQNQYAETLFRTIGGRDAVLRALEPWGISPADLVQRDGSGLSRYDLVTPDALVTILSHVWNDQRLKDPFVASLPVAGDVGLSTRMKATAAEGNARAKTGSMTAVRALSGYVSSAEREPLVFAIVANNFEVDAPVVNRATDAIVVKLAELRRSSQRRK